jgi:hypothetical protein
LHKMGVGAGRGGARNHTSEPPRSRNARRALKGREPTVDGRRACRGTGSGLRARSNACSRGGACSHTSDSKGGRRACRTRAPSSASSTGRGPSTGSARHTRVGRTGHASTPASCHQATMRGVHSGHATRLSAVIEGAVGTAEQRSTYVAKSVQQGLHPALHLSQEVHTPRPVPRLRQVPVPQGWPVRHQDVGAGGDASPLRHTRCATMQAERHVGVVPPAPARMPGVTSMCKCHLSLSSEGAWQLLARGKRTHWQVVPPSGWALE